MSKLLENEVTAKIVETKSMKATITIQKILDIICEKWSSCLDGYYIYNEEPVLSSDNYSDTSVTVNLYNSDRVKIDNIIDDVTMLFEEELEDFVKKSKIDMMILWLHLKKLKKPNFQKKVKMVAYNE